MAAPVKKREIQRDTERTGSNDDDQSSSNSGENEQDISDEQGMEIQVDFEGRSPLDPDYHGIKTLLQQLFLKAHVDLGALTDLIISQNYVGSVVKQSENFEESDDDETDVNDVFGITTVINISKGQDSHCIEQLRDLLKQFAIDHTGYETHSVITKVLEEETTKLGLLINERFVNIPAQISVPLLENLISEIKRANTKKMPFDFSHYLLICKLYKMKDTNIGKKVKNKKKDYGEEPTVIWSNPEEEFFAEEASISFEFSVEMETDSGLSGKWTETDDEMIPYRKVIMFEASKLQSIIDKIKNHVS